MRIRDNRLLAAPATDPYPGFDLALDMIGAGQGLRGRPFYKRGPLIGFHPKELGGWSFGSSGIETFPDLDGVVQFRPANDDTMLPRDGGLWGSAAATNICTAANWNPTVLTGVGGVNGAVVTIVAVGDLPENVRKRLLRRYPNATAVFKCVCPGAVPYEGVTFSGQLAANTAGSLQIAGFIESGATVRFGLRGSTNLTGGAAALGSDFENVKLENIQSSASRPMGIQTDPSVAEASTFYFLMFQMEVGANCSPCIPSEIVGTTTRGGTVPRLSYSLPNGDWSVLLDLIPYRVAGFPVATQFDDGTNNNYVQFYFGSGGISVSGANGGAAQPAIAAGAVAVGQQTTVVVSRRGAEVAITRTAGGGAPSNVVKRSDWAWPTTTRIDMHANASGAGQVNGPLRRLLVRPVALNDAAMQAWART